jgi:CDGSH-type Zn-finger protein
MNKADCPKNAPYIVKLTKGTHWWCACGKSTKQPFCDGSHRDTDFSPVKMEITEERTAHLCGCKKTGRAPFCDGSHNIS